MTKFITRYEVPECLPSVFARPDFDVDVDLDGANVGLGPLVVNTESM